MFPKAIITIPIAAIIIANQTFNKIFSFKNKKPNLNIIKNACKNIGKNKKAYALRFVLQEKNKTLDDKTINSIMNNLIKEFEKKLNAEIRK